MVKGGHYEHYYSSCLNKVLWEQLTHVLRNVFQARQAYSTVLYKDTSHIVHGSRPEGTCTNTGGTCPLQFHILIFFVLQGGVQELRMDQPCGPLLYVPGKFFWYCYKT